jgi:phosphonopyruvate decarboxylase
MALDAARFMDELRDRGLSLWTGVPCSLLGPMLAALPGREDLEHVPLSNEGEAVAYAAGAALAGRRAVVYLQNSGLGNAVNPLTSLAGVYGLDMLLLCSWRGEPGRPDAPQHLAMGALTPDLLEAVAGYRVLREEDASESMAWAAEEGRGPRALLVPKGAFEAGGASGEPRSAPAPGTLCEGEDGPAELSRGAALAAIDEVVGGRAPVVATTGKTSRELHALGDRDGHFYMVGSMGCAPSLALGVARHRPGGGPVVCLDGDGAALMRLEGWAGVAAYAPAGFVHVLLDNGVHDSTGGQPSLGPSFRFAAIAHSLGYAHSVRARTARRLGEEVAAALERPGPTLVHVPTRPGSPEGLGRPGTDLPGYRDRFRSYLRSGVDAD